MTKDIGIKLDETKWGKRYAKRQMREKVLALLEKRKWPDTRKFRKKARRIIKKQEARAARPRGHEVTFSQTDTQWQIIYGLTRVGGAFTFAHNPDPPTYLHHIITLAGHQINSVEKVYLDNFEVIFSGNSSTQFYDTKEEEYKSASNIVEWYLNDGNPSNPAIPEIIANLPDYWTADHKQQGRAHGYMKLKFNGQLFPSGAPDIQFLIKGKKCYDPRSGLTVWTSNAALIIGDYLTNTEYGMGFAYSDIENLSDAADICDENVNLKGGGTEKRYTINGAFLTGEEHGSILSEFAGAIAGEILQVAGKWKILCGKYYAPSITLTENDLRSTPIIETLHPRSSLFNTVKGTFPDPLNKYEVIDYPAVTNNLWKIQDNNEELYAEYHFPFTVSPATCQRIAKIELERERRQISLTADWSLKAYPLEVGDAVYITLSRYGWTNKEFIVESYQFAVKNQEAVISVVLREYDSNVYAWTGSAEENEIVRPALRTKLPNPYKCAAPTNLTLESGTEHLYLRKDGTVINRIFASWTAPADIYVIENGSLELEYKKTTDSQYQVIPLTGESTQAYITDVETSKIYNIRIRAKNQIGIYSSYLSTTHEVIGKSEAPSDVASFFAVPTALGVDLQWTEILDLDRSKYQIRRGGTTWETATEIATVAGNKFFDEFYTSGTTKYWIKAIDTSGNISNTAKEAEIVIEIPNAVGNLYAEVIDNNVLLRWTAPTATSFPISHYKVYKGADFDTAEFVGSVDGTFAVKVETVGGNYIYWVVAVDEGGNIGIEEDCLASAMNPPDYILHSDLNLTVADGTFTNCAEDDEYENAILAPVNNTESFQEHFDDNTYTTPQDQIDDGNPIYVQPTDGLTSEWELKKDYGAVITSSIISLSWIEETVDGAVTITPTISISEDDITYTDYSGQSRILGANFRYVKYKLEFNPSDNTGLIKVYNINARLDVKKQTDSGSGTSSATLGTDIYFNYEFISVTGITITCKTATAGEALIPVYDFSGDPYEDHFTVKVYDRATGNQVARDFTWVAEGIVSTPV